jgi:hypothetical protein
MQKFVCQGKGKSVSDSQDLKYSGYNIKRKVVTTADH